MTERAVGYTGLQAAARGGTNRNEVEMQASAGRSGGLPNRLWRFENLQHSPNLHF